MSAQRTDISVIVNKKMTIKPIREPYDYLGFYIGKKLVAQVRYEDLYDGIGNRFDPSILDSES